MKLRKLLALPIFASLICGAFAFSGSKSTKTVAADQTADYPGYGYSGSAFYVNGCGNFAKDVADLAVCFWDINSSAYAWTPRISQRVYGDYMRVVIPTYQGNNKQWNRFKVCRYRLDMDPQVSGDYGVYNKTADITFEFLYNQNTIEITGYEGDQLKYSRNHFDQYGVRAENHMYLDLSGFEGWEEGNAKFAIWFGYASNAGNSCWGQSYEGGSYHSSFCWKVEGQDNPHLYECVVPNVGTEINRNIWSMVIAVRFNPTTGEPNWDGGVWNKTQDIFYNKNNHEANMIRITNWGDGYVDADNVINKNDRIGFYGSYFLDTVACSGTGNSDSTTSDMWNAVKGAYGHLSRVFQGDVWTTFAKLDGTMIQQAMARYDYIVLYKQYNHEDFINRAESPNRTEYVSEAFVETMIHEDSNLYIVITIIALVSTLSLTSLLILKKRIHR